MSDVIDRVTVSVNGEPREVSLGTSVAALVAELALDTRKVAVERNREIVSRSAYASVFLQAGDALEIVHFIGGG